MHQKALPRGSLKLLEKLSAVSSVNLEGWILAGGTGLALQLGHRISKDFDFFRTDAMDVGQLHDTFRNLADYETLQDSEHTLTIIMFDTKVSFFQIADPFIFPSLPYYFFSIAAVQDIALMKLIALAARGSKKDFIDLFTILRQGSVLSDYFELLPEKYGKKRINTYHILKSLTYFEDAEHEPMPVMLEPFDWEECKRFFIRQAHSLVLPPSKPGPLPKNKEKKVK